MWHKTIITKVCFKNFLYLLRRPWYFILYGLVWPGLPKIDPTNLCAAFLRCWYNVEKHFTHFCKMLMLLGEFHCSKWPNIVQIIKPFGHTVLLWHEWLFSKFVLYAIQWFKFAPHKGADTDSFVSTLLGRSFPVWPDFEKFHHLGKSLQIYGKFLKVYFLFGKMLSLLWQICDIIWLIFIVANG